MVQPATGSLCRPSLPQAPVSRLKAMSAPRALEKTGAPGAEAEKALSLGIRSDGCPNVLAPGQILGLSPPLQMSASIAESHLVAEGPVKPAFENCFFCSYIGTGSRQLDVVERATSETNALSRHSLAW